MPRILIVHHEPVLCEIIVMGLDCVSPEVTYALTGALAEEMILQKRFALILINASIAEPSGIQLAKRAADRKIPALLLSGHPDVLRELKKLGYPHLENPFSMSVLISKVNNIINNPYDNISSLNTAAARLHTHIDGLLRNVAYRRQFTHWLLAV